MTLRVPSIAKGAPKIAPTSTEVNDIRSATPVRGESQWQQMSRAVNWVLGHGGSLAVAGPIRPNVATSVTAVTALIHVWPRDRHSTRVFTFGMRVNNVVAQGTIDITVPGAAGTQIAFALNAEPIEQMQYVEVIQDFSAVTTSGVMAITFNVTQVTSAVVQIESISAFELPRYYMPSTVNTIGMHEMSCKRNASITDDNGAPEKDSITGVWDQAQQAKTLARRQKVFDWSLYGAPSSLTGISVSTTAYTSIFDLSAVAQARHIENTVVVKPLEWRVLASVSAGSGNIRVATVSGDADSIAITATTETWHTGSINVDTDDLSATANIRGGTRDLIKFTARKNVSGSLKIYAINVGEAP